MYRFYKSVFSDNVPLSNKNISVDLTDTNLPKLSMEQRQLCEGEVIEKKVKDALHKIKNNNDSLTKEFFETFWLEIKSLLFYLSEKVF